MAAKKRRTGPTGGWSGGKADSGSRRVFTEQRRPVLCGANRDRHLHATDSQRPASLATRVAIVYDRTWFLRCFSRQRFSS